MARSLVKNVKEIDSCFLLLADDKYCASCAAEATCRDRRQQPKDSFEEVPPAPSITPEPCANCFNPDASGPVCTACRYPRFILDPAARYPGIGCVCCLWLNLEHLDNGHCTPCRKAWPGFVAPAAN